MAGRPPLPVAADAPVNDDSDRPEDERCRKEENVFDCIIRMNQVNCKKTGFTDDDFDSRV